MANTVTLDTPEKRVAFWSNTKFVVKHNPNTGAKRPFEVWQESPAGIARVWGSYSTEAAAIKKGIKKGNDFIAWSLARNT